MEELARHQEEYGNTSVLDTPTFFYGLRPGEETRVEIERGKTLIIKLIDVRDPKPNGMREILFELNGSPREVEVPDHRVVDVGARRPKADKGDPCQLGASMPGKVVKVLVAPGDEVAKGVQLVVTEAMKMENVLTAPRDCKIKDVLVKEGDRVEAGDLLVVLEG
ncbi:MAG: hypothetical protein A6D92_23000 [Symbiobacterium thermophilum]|uniref:Lipoyl-binding domain-containing protein n=1 Tax=Symbiobacterium thermophilum TaxID=2734 RepID=A0A1Y2T0Y4_SYMTR|nr:MAG: hypothetical protein A6D92_23000 [Symbiobacterium thermophilum]